MTKYAETLRDEDQRPISGAKVYVYDSNGALDALTNDSAASIANPVVSDEFGNVSFNASDGHKTLDIFLGPNRIWREVVILGPTNDAANVATRALMAGLSGANGTARYLSEAGREGIFIFDSADHSAHVTADSRQGVYVAPTGQNGSAGAWVRKHKGELDIRWFGAVQDCTQPGTGTPNAAAINGAIAVAAITKGAEILIPRGNLGFRVESTLVFTGGVKIKGQAFSQSPIATYPTAPQHLKASMLVFDANVAALKFLAYTDHAANAQVVQYESAVFSVIEDIVLYGGGGTTVTAHGIETRTVLHCRNVRVEAFGGEGLHVEASTSGTGLYGNANRSKFDHCFFVGNGCHGAHLKGTDANAIKFDTCEFTTNGGLGVLDETGIGGNSYDDCVFELNNTSYGASTAQRTQVLADFAGLSDQAFGSIAFTSTNVPHSCRHCYNETGGFGMKAHLPIGVNVHGGLLGQPESWDATSSPNGINSSNGTNYIAALKAPGSATTITVSPQLVWNVDLGWGGVASDARINWSANGGLMMGGNGTSQDFTLFNASALSAMYVNHNSRNVNFQADVVLNNGNLVFGSTTAINSSGVLQAAAHPALTGDVTTSAGSLATTLAAATVVSKIAGQAIAPSNVAATGSLTSSSASLGIGYATGAGGTVTQATSRSTGVTLNKACGAITLFSTTTAAGQHDRFTVTNSAVAATDVVNVAMKTGSSKYIVSVLSTAAGSFDIGVYTPAAVGSAEAPVINFAVMKAVTA